MFSFQAKFDLDIWLAPIACVRDLQWTDTGRVAIYIYYPNALANNFDDIIHGPRTFRIPVFAETHFPRDKSSSIRRF